MLPVIRSMDYREMMNMINTAMQMNSQGWISATAPSQPDLSLGHSTTTVQSKLMKRQ